jgi:site-specific recombinase XerD
MAKVRRHTNGKWFVDFIVRIGKTSRRNRVYGFDSKGEAEAFKTQLILRPLDQAIDFQQIIITPLGKAIEEYKTNSTAKKASKQSEDVFFDKLEEFLSTRKDFDGNVSSINPLMIANLQTWLLNHEYTRFKPKKKHLQNPELLEKAKKNAKRFPFSPSTVNRYFHTYRNFFEKCREWNFIRKNPCEFLQDLPVEENRRRTWTAQQCLEILGELPDWAQRALLGIAGTGARRGECCRLFPEKVDLQTGHIFLRSKKGRGVWKERPVPMTPGFQRFMADQLELCRKNKWTYVFVNHEGNPISMAYLTKIVTKKAIKRGYKGLTIHGLRHTLLSALANSGENLNAVRLLAGHSNLSTTQRYLHTSTKDMEAALNRSEYLGELQKIMAPKGQKEEGPADD